MAGCGLPTYIVFDICIYMYEWFSGVVLETSLGGGSSRAHRDHTPCLCISNMNYIGVVISVARAGGSFACAWVFLSLGSRPSRNRLRYPLIVHGRRILKSRGTHVM